MRNLAIILAVAVLATYAFIAVNERQKEQAIRTRLPKFRKINKYEFDKALYQVRETRSKMTHNASRHTIQNEDETNTKNDFYKDYEYIENLKNSPSTEVQPVQDQGTDYYQQQQPIPQEDSQIVTQQQEPQEDNAYPEQQPQPLTQPAKKIYRYTAPTVPDQQQR